MSTTAKIQIQIGDSEKDERRKSNVSEANGVNAIVKNKSSLDLVEADTLAQEKLKPPNNGQEGSTIVSFVLPEKHKSTDKEKKTNRPLGSRTRSLSVLYAVIICLIGTVLPVTEALKNSWFTEDFVGAFMTYMTGVASCFLIYLQTLLILNGRKMKKKKKENLQEEKKEPQSTGNVMLVRRRINSGNSSTDLTAGDPPESPIEMKPFGKYLAVPESNGIAQRKSSEDSAFINNGFSDENGNNEQVTNGEAVTRMDSPQSDTLENDFYDVRELVFLHTNTASQAHEGTSFYVRLGALIFGVGNIIYVSLQLEYYLGGHVPASCSRKTVSWPMWFHLIFIMTQTFFLFKNTHIYVKSGHKGFCQFGLMHVVATNICIWMRICVYEVMEGILHAGEDHSEQFAPESPSNGTTCSNKGSLLAAISPYLYPFVLEYSLIAVGIMAGLYSELGVVVTKDIVQTAKKIMSFKERGLDSYTGKPDAHLIHSNGIDFEKSHAGGFLGFLILTGSVISIIFFYSLNQNTSEQKQTAAILFYSSDLALSSCMFLAMISAFYKFSQLSYCDNRDNTIDDSLLALSMGGGVLLEMFCLVATITYVIDKRDELLSSLELAAAVISLLEIITQTLFIVDALHRYAPTEKLREDKPGRGTIAFLLICNVASWIFESFQIKNVAFDHQSDFFGIPAWPIILNVASPLMLFFRFHSSICLADIWVEAYHDEEEPLYDTLQQQYIL